MASSEDIYDVVAKIRRRLVDEWCEAWVRGNDERCAKIMNRGFSSRLFDNWIPKGLSMPTMFHPLADRVLVKPEDTSGEKRSPSGLVIIPDMGKTRANTGFVMAIGPDCQDIELGDKVLFGKYAGSDIKLNEEEMVICRIDDILGIITEEPDEDNVDQGSGEPDPPA